MWSKHLHAFSRLLKKKDLKEEIVTKIELYNLVKSTTLESNKSQRGLCSNGAKTWDVSLEAL